jgi:hypothetical protein
MWIVGGAAANQPLHLTRRHYGFSEFNVSPAAAQVNGGVIRRVAPVALQPLGADRPKRFSWELA